MVEVDKDKVDKTVNEIHEIHHRTWDNDFFSSDQAKQAMDKLEKLNSAELTEVLGKLKSDTRQDMVRDDFTTDMNDWDLRTDMKYQKLANAVWSGDPNSEYIKEKQAAEGKDAEIKFATIPRGFDSADEGDHLYRIELWPPVGTKKDSLLDKAVKDTRYAMQMSIDTLGTGKPLKETDFSGLLDSTLIDNAEGVSQLRENHSGLTDHLKQLQDERAKWKGEVDKNIFESNDKGKELFGTLTGVYKELKQFLEWNFPKGDGKNEDIGTLTKSNDGNDLIYKPGKKDVEGLDYLPDKSFPMGAEHPLFKKNKDTGEFELTPAAEQKYLKAIDIAAGEWDKAYAAAAEYVRKKSGTVDASDPDGSDGKSKPPAKEKETPTENQQPPTGNQQPPTGNQQPPTGNGQQPPTGNGQQAPTGNGQQTPNDTGTGDDAETKEILAQLGSNTEDGAVEQVGDSTGTGTGNETSGSGKDSDGTTGTGTDSIQQAIDDIKESATGNNEGVQQAANNPAANPLGALGPALGSSLGALGPLGNQFGQMMGGGQMKPESGGADSALYQPQSGTAGSPSPGAATAQASVEAPPGGTAAPAGTTPPPNPNPNAPVDLKMQGVEPHQVSSGVAEALQKAMQIPNGSDANAAYSGIAPPDSPEHPWPKATDGPKTGDVVKWGDQSALVVVDGSGPRMIVGQRLVPVVQGEGFEGFFRPPSSGAAQSVPQAVGSAAPSGTQQV
ncbi:hypothetical protein [Nocardia thraciensis]